MNLSERQRQCLELLDIDVWVRRNLPPERQANPAPATLPAKVIDEPAWQALRAEVAACTRCALHRGRTQTVFSAGNPAAEWLLIGEAPGKEEDRQGEPFVGRAGKLLNSMLAAMGLRRDDVCIINILKCRPPDNRDPKPEEALTCEPYLKRQIALIRPKIILALGRIAAQNLLQVETPIGRMRGQVYEYPDPRTPVIVSYHPAYLLRKPSEKRRSWEDLKFAMRVFREQS
ncbi:MAG: uracil-DNA glycosylase [Gammaproteobacteria bacterium]|nr:uracil-DNA glycosylase [Gammaproteobacteria bacterium]